MAATPTDDKANGRAISYVPCAEDRVLAAQRQANTSRRAAEVMREISSPPAEADSPQVPHDLAVEQALIGSMLIDPDCIGTVRETVSDADAFFSHRHQIIAREIFVLVAAGTTPDAVTLPARLRETGNFDVVGGKVYLTELINCVPSAANAGNYAKIIRDLAGKRRQIAALAGGAQDLMEGATPESVAAVVRAAMAPTTAAEPPELILAYMPAPLDALPLAISEFVAPTANALPCAPEMVLLPLLAALGAAIGNTRRVELKSGWTEPSVIWVATVAKSGTLKSQALEKATNPLMERQRQAFREYKQALREYQVEMMTWEDNKRSRRKNQCANELTPPPEPPVCVRYWLSDCTVEAIAPVLADNWRGVMVVRDELAGWFGSFDRYTTMTGGDVPAWLSMHRAGSITIDRKTGQRIIHVDHAFVGVAGTIQPGILRRALTSEYFAAGLPARLLLAMPDHPRRRWNENIVSAEITAALDSVFGGLLELQPKEFTDKSGENIRQPIVLPLSADAKRQWVEFYDAHADEMDGLADNEAAAWSKLEGYGARFALIFTLVRNPAAVEIDMESMVAAIRLTRWFCRETKRVYAMLRETPAQAQHRELIRFIKQRFRDRITVRELARCGGYRAPGQAEAALEGLVPTEAHREVSSPGPAGGRPSTVYVLNGSDDTKCDKTSWNVSKSEVLSQSVVSQSANGKAPQTHGGNDLPVDSDAEWMDFQ